MKTKHIFFISDSKFREILLKKRKYFKYKKQKYKKSIFFVKNRKRKLIRKIIVIYCRRFLELTMKKTVFLFILLFTFSFVVSGETLNLSYINKREFISDINTALISESPEILVKAATPYLTKMHEANIPDCFSCSLHLIKVTEKADSEMQLAAADLAVKFSNDLPEAHHHYFARLLRFAPLHVNKISNQLFATVNTSMRFIFKDSIIFLFVKSLAAMCVIFFILFIGVMSLKYTGMIVHKYKHLVGFSRFYGVAFIVAFLVAAGIISENFPNIVFVLIPFLIFFGDLGTRSEKIVLHVTVLLFVVATAFSMLSEKDKINQYNQNIAFDHLAALISPDMLSENNIDMSQPGAYMAKGFLFLYNHNFSRAAFNLKKELDTAEVPEIKLMLSNALGIALASNGKQKEAIPYLQAVYNVTKDKRIGYNLAKVLYEDGFTKEGEELEHRVLSSASSEIFSYPFLYFTDFSNIWEYLCYGNSGTGGRNKIHCLLYIVVVLLFYVFVILIKYTYLNSLKISRCPECGSVLCSKCSAGGNDICAVCKLMKADYTLFKRGEREIYENNRESFFRRRSILMNIITFALPGGGLMFIDRVLEGSLYLALPLIVTLIYFFNTMGLVVDTAEGSMIKITIILIDLLFYFLSVIRALFAARRS